jgi:hypothetical protein
VNPTILKSPVTLSQTAVPIQVCYIVPIGSPPEMLTAIFEECHNRWGGRDSLIMPMLADGTIDDKYWVWARDLDPDIIYSYSALDVPMLERIDRDLMPSVVSVHRNDWNPDDWRPRHDTQAEGLPALSLLPMLANSDRLGPPGRFALVSGFIEWPKDRFVTDSFGLNPFGPGWAQANAVRKYVDTLALGSQATAQRGNVADAEIANPTALLRAMANNTYRAITMAQLSGIGYPDVFRGRVSSWHTSFNIVVGEATLDRLAFWNSRIGVDDWQRKNIVGLRLDETHLEDPEFISALALFISRWNTSKSQSGPSFATVRSSSVADDCLQPIVEALRPVNVHATVKHFNDINDCAPAASDKFGFVRPGIDERYTESSVPLVPLQPTHLTAAGPMSAWFTTGGWAAQITLKRETGRDWSSSIPRLRIPRRWQAVRAIAGSCIAKATIDGDLRLVVHGAAKPEMLSFTDDDAEFVARLFIQHHYLTTTDPRNTIPKTAPIYPQTSSAGRHLRGLLNKLGSIQSASMILEDQFWQAVFLDMAVPREVFDDTKRAELAARLKKPIQRDGPAVLASDADFESLAETVAQIAPDLKMPVAKRNFDWFVKMYSETTEAKRPRDPALTPAHIERHIQQEVEEQLRWRCAEGVLIQGHDWKCPRCLHRNWSTVDALGAVLTCEVCNRQEPISANFSWDFLLDGYVALGLRERGLRGLVWSLGSLSWSAKESFLFSPPLDLVQGGVLLTDSDISCVVDNKFIIGEVKESDRKINDALGDRLISVARVVRPDVVILACLDPSSSPTVQRQTDRIRDAIRDLGIDVKPMVRDAQYTGVDGMMVARGMWMAPVPTLPAPAMPVVPATAAEEAAPKPTPTAGDGYVETT